MKANFDILKRNVIDKGLCCRCGTCSSFCNRISLNGNGIPELTDACVVTEGALKCGLCCRQCPMLSRPPHSSGKILDASVVKSRFFNERAQDGGAVSQMLSDAMNKGIIDTALVSSSSPSIPWFPLPLIAQNDEDILASMSSRYSFSSSNVLLKEAALNSEQKSLVVVGMPCQIKAVRLAEKKLGVKIFTIGLFCTQNFFFEEFSEAIKPHLEKAGLSMDQVDKMNISKGYLRMDGVKVKLNEFKDIIPPSCLRCGDFSAELADVSVGSAGAPDGWSSVVVRTDRGLELKSCISENAEVGEIDLAQIEKLSKIKKEKVIL